MLNRIILRFGHKFSQPLCLKKFNSGVLKTENSSKLPTKYAVEFHEARLHFCAESKFASVELIQKGRGLFFSRLFCFFWVQIRIQCWMLLAHCEFRWFGFAIIAEMWQILMKKQNSGKGIVQNYSAGPN